MEDDREKGNSRIGASVKWLMGASVRWLMDASVIAAKFIKAFIIL